MVLVYVSRPSSTHAVVKGQHVLKFDIIKITPGTVYGKLRAYPSGEFVGERDDFKVACEWADLCARMERK